MDGPRAPAEQEYNELLQFLKQTLRPDEQWNLSDEYPTALSMSNLHNVRIIKDDKILSHAVLKPLIIKSPVMIWKVAAIGSVVTDETHRNQGLSRKVIADCLDEAKKQNCDIAILWTSLHDFYRKLGFELAGSEVSFTVDRVVISSSPSQMIKDQIKFLDTLQVSPEALLKVYNQHTVGSSRTAEDFKKFLQIPNTKLYTAWNNQNQLVAYAVEGKGADLKNYFHEWGGSVAHLTALVGWIWNQRQQPFHFMLGGHNLNLATHFVRSGLTEHQGFLGMIKIVSRESFFAKVRKAAKSIGVGDFVLESAGQDRTRIGFLNDSVMIEDERDLVKVLFGPVPEIPALKNQTMERLERILPLPLWIWGWDSI